MTKSALAKEKGVQVKDLVADSQGHRGRRRCDGKFPQVRAFEFFTDDPETLCYDWFVLDYR
jgi:hypothetical protein